MVMASDDSWSCWRRARRARSERWTRPSGRETRTRRPRRRRPATVAEPWGCVLVLCGSAPKRWVRGHGCSCGQHAFPGSASRPGIARVRTGCVARGPRLPRGRASRRARRELMPSFVNTFFRCHSTVRGLRKSAAPISGSSGRRGRAGRCAPPGSELVARVVAALADLLAGGQQLVPRTLGESLRAHREKRLARARSCSRASTRRPSRRSHSP